MEPFQLPSDEEIGILPNLHGRKSYFYYTAVLHKLCNAHNLRELIFLIEHCPQDWEQNLIGLLLEIKKSADQARGKQSELSAVLFAICLSKCVL